MAASPGLEPRLTESESAVLPLDDEAIELITHYIYAFLLLLSNGLLKFYLIDSINLCGLIITPIFSLKSPVASAFCQNSCPLRFELTLFANKYNPHL